MITPIRKCTVCGDTLIKRAHESNARYGKKKFCSPECSRKWMKENRVGWWGRRAQPSLPYDFQEE